MRCASLGIRFDYALATSPARRIAIKYQTRIRPRGCTHANAVDEGEQACITMECIAVACLHNFWRKTNAGHVSLGQLKVMSAIESCRTAALGAAPPFFAADAARPCR